MRAPRLPAGRLPVEATAGSVPHTPELARIAAELNREHDLATRHAATALQHARRCGVLLSSAKSALGHGAWSAWLRQHFSGSERTAQRYMRLASRWLEVEAKTATLADLGVVAAEALITRPQPPLDHDDLELVDGIELRAWLPSAGGLWSAWETHDYGYTGLIASVGEPAGHWYAVARVVVSKHAEEGEIEGWGRGIRWDRVPYLLARLGLPDVGHEVWQPVDAEDPILRVIDRLKGAPPMPRPFGAYS